MKRLIALILTMGMAATNAPAMDSVGMEMTYTGGTVPGVRPGVDGTLETTSPTAVEFHTGSGEFSVPYAGITTAKYHEENRFRLGALPAIGVGLLKARSKRRLVTITWKDEKGVVQVAIFEASKQKSHALLTIIRIRAPQVCPTKGDCLGGEPN
jgi:hypothetical protein